jgi:type II secretory pathway pseudopilin PulG
VNDLPATITALGTLVAAIGALVISWNNRRAAAEAREKAAVAAAAAEAAKLAALDSQREIIATKEGVFEVGKQIDGRLTELLTLTKESALAEGRLEGAATERATRPESA